MKKFKSFIFLFVLLFLLSCEIQQEFIDIIDTDFNLLVNETKQLNVSKSEDIPFIYYSSNNSNVSVDENGLVTALKEGESIIKAYYDSFFDEVTVTITDVRKNSFINIKNNDTKVAFNQSFKLDIEKSSDINEIFIKVSNDCVIIDEEYNVTGVKEGNCIITVYNGDISDEIYVIVEKEEIKLTIKSDKDSMFIGEYLTLSYDICPLEYDGEIEYSIVSGNDISYISNNFLYATHEGMVKIIGSINDIISDSISIIIYNNIEDSDPYESVSEEEFYAHYTPAISYKDAYYRSLHYFLSGDNLVPDQEPDIDSNRPIEDGLFIRNTNELFEDNGNTYVVRDSNGNVINKIYKDGAYITLEEVAAYIYAFRDVPKNYNSNKNLSPKESDWDEFLRVNNTFFSGDVKEYPYEPILPDIKGVGGDLYYYETDIGTTGTDCDPKYESKLYNNGKKITRGAARIVYVRYDGSKGNIVSDILNKYVFYTYNHYNDFREYLNYYNGWGEMFGNITGGGTISSKEDYNPTSYVDILLKDLFGNDNNNSLNNEYLNNIMIYDNIEIYYLNNKNNYLYQNN